MATTLKKRKIVGRREKVSFPELDIKYIDAKIDTGAYSSVLHCHHINVYEFEGEWYVKFSPLDPEHPEYSEKEFSFPVHSKKTIKNSFGESETRYFIKTKISLFKTRYPIELSLTDRSSMDFPVLIGRKLLHGRFLVNVSRTNQSFKSILKQKAEKKSNKVS
jgi:hypothetical protein